MLRMKFLAAVVSCRPDDPGVDAAMSCNLRFQSGSEWVEVGLLGLTRACPILNPASIHTGQLSC